MKLNVEQAAEVIGCTPRHVRFLISKQILAATKELSGWHMRYYVDRKEAERYRDTPQRGGFPRGHKRNGR